MLGIDSFTAIINPPQAALLAVGAAKRGVTVREDSPAVGWSMPLTLCCDHRVLSGGDGARFLADVAGLLESPGGLVL
jgi:pyruvate dehydrogenase E2 component (dihydrolipoamide acetyltransferase)